MRVAVIAAKCRGAIRQGPRRCRVPFMTDARAFGYVRYNPDEVDPATVLAPPYDVISDDERAQLAASSPHSSVLLELPEGGDNQAAGDLLRRWIDEDVL